MSSLVFQSLNAVPGYRRVSDMIEAEILSGRIKAGDILPTEGDLATQLGVHRSTIREGIRSLENSGLIKRISAKRLMVTVPDSQGVAWAAMRALGLRRVSFIDLWEVQMNMEPFCARIASQRITDAAAEALSENVKSLGENLDDEKSVVALDSEFHRLVAEASGNVALILTREPISILLSTATTALYRKVPQARHRMLAAHRAICDAIVSRDADTAQLWMERHIRDFRRGYLVAGTDLDAPLDISLETMAAYAR